MSCSVPPYLNTGDTIAVVAPAGKINPEIIKSAALILQSWGLKVIDGKHSGQVYFSFAAADKERRQDFQQMLDDPNVKAILCARGGYGSARIIDDLDFSGFLKNPKWIIGFSDITVFHSHLNSNFRIETLHATMSAGLVSEKSSPDTLQSLKDALFGKTISYTIPFHPLSRKGKSLAELCGGNLAIICSLIGTPSALKTKGKILFIEEIGENLYRIDRMINQLKRAGMLSHLAGLIVGGLTDIPNKKEDYGKSAEDIILEAVADFDFPVCFGFPAGHQDDNRALIFGRTVELVVDNEQSIRFNS